MRLILIILLATVASRAIANEIVAVSDGDWTDKTIWSCKCIPGKDDHVVIPAGITVSSRESRLLNFGAKIALMIDGKLELKGGNVHLDAEDFIAVGAGGMITAGKAGAVLYSGILPYFVTVNAPIMGPATLSAGVLPNNITYFKAALSKNEVLLTWSTSIAHPDDVYTLQRSADGIKFETLTEIYGGNDGGKKLDCSYYDVEPLKGMAYYRLLKDNGKEIATGITINIFPEGALKKTF